MDSARRDSERRMSSGKALGMNQAKRRELRAAVADSSLKLDEQHVAAHLRDACTPHASSGRMQRQVERAIESLVNAGTPDVLFRLHEVKRMERCIEIQGRRLGGRRLRQAFRYCDLGVVYVLTLGTGVDRVLEDMRAKSASRWYVYDQVASRYAEYVCQEIRERLKRLLDEPWGVTERYSPGYCDWPLKEQHRVFSLLPHKPLGVTVNSEGLMAPRKSVSGLMGIGPAFLTQLYGNACFSCLRSDCAHRRTDMPV